MPNFFSLSDPLGLTSFFDLKYTVRYFERKAAMQTVQKEHKREGSNVILTLETLNVKLRGRTYSKKMTQKAFMFEISDKKTRGLWGRKMTEKIEE